MFGCCVGTPVCCPPTFCVQDFYTTRTIPVIHPVVNVNRVNVVNVPQHFVRPMSTTVPGQNLVGTGMGTGVGTGGFFPGLFGGTRLF